MFHMYHKYAPLMFLLFFFPNSFLFCQKEFNQVLKFCMCSLLTIILGFGSKQKFRNHTFHYAIFGWKRVGFLKSRPSVLKLCMRPYVTKIEGFHTHNKCERNFGDMGAGNVLLVLIGGQGTCQLTADGDLGPTSEKFSESLTHGYLYIPRL